MLTALKVARAQQLPLNVNLTVAPIVIPGDGTGVCPSEQERRSARQNLTNSVRSMLSPRSITVEQCGAGIWRQLASVNMSETTSRCPEGWVEENEGGVRACGRGAVSTGCNSAFFSSGEYAYSKFCGRAISYRSKLC